jgi:hypothetical protein
LVVQPNNSGPGLLIRSPGFDPGGTCLLIDEALDLAGCAALVRAAAFSPTGLQYPPSYRDNDRAVLDDPALAARLFARLQALLPPTLEGGWRLVGLNERFRFCRYEGGQGFCIHRDGAHARGSDERSRLTLQIYLDADPALAGGRTRFFASQRGAEVGSVAPRTGTAIVFDHGLWHDGEPVTRGVKHVLRTDVMYRRQRQGAASREAGAEEIVGHTGYVYAARALRDGRVVTASRDRTLRVSRREAGGWRTEQVLSGHGASVFAVEQVGRGGSALVSASRDGSVRAWELATGLSRVIASHDGAALCLSPLGGGVASGGADGTICAVDDAGASRRIVGHEGWVWAVAALAGGVLASASEDGTVRTWDAARGAALDVLVPGGGAALSLAALGSGELAVGLEDGSVAVLSVDAGGRLSAGRRFVAHEGRVVALSGLGPGVLATAGEDCEAHVVSAQDGSQLATVRHGDFVRSVSPLGSGGLLTASYDGTARFTPPWGPSPPRPPPAGPSSGQ